MAKLTILYHSQSGRNRRLALAASEATQIALDESEEVSHQTEVQCLRFQDADAAVLFESDALLFVTPENFGALAGATKDFFDRTFYAVEKHQLNLPYGLIVCCGNDGTGAIKQLQKIAKAYPFKQVAEPLIVHGDPSDEAFQAASEMGQTLAVGAAMGIF